MAELDPKDIQAAQDLFKKMAESNPVYARALEMMKSEQKLRKQAFEFQEKSWPKQKKQLEDYTNNIKLLNGGFPGFVKGFKDGKAKIEEFKVGLDQLDKEIENSKEGSRKQQLEYARGQMALKIFGASVESAGISLTKALTTNLLGGVTDTAGKFVRGLQDNASATSLSTTIMSGAVDMATGAVSAAGSGLSQVGSAAATLGKPGGKMQMLGIAAELAGSAISAMGASAGKLAKFGIEVLSKEVEKTVKAFNDTSSAGAMFTDGMTGMRKAASAAGLTTDQFAAVVKANSQSLAQSGLGVSEGATAIGRAMKVGGKEAQQQLLNLGYSFEEQAGLYAETTAAMRRSTGGRASDQQVAEATRQYAENLRTIAAITGEDAKRKTEEARQQNQILAFQQELAKKTPEQRAQIDAAMATMTEQEKKNFRDRVVLGTVINKEGAIYEATVAGARSKGEAALRLFENNELTAKKNAELNAEYGDTIKESILSNKTLGVASYAAGGVVQDVGKGMLDSVNQAVTYTAEAVKNGQAVVQEQKATNDALTSSVTGAAQAAQDLKVGLQEVLLPAIQDFARVSKEILESVSKTVRDTMGTGGEESLWDKIKRVGGAVLGGAATGGQMGGTAGAVVGSVVPGIGTVTGGTIGTIGGALIGAIAAGFSEWFGKKEGKAEGGVAEGPETGFLEKLHGTEAVIPLENGRSVPVSLDVSGMAKVLADAAASGGMGKALAGSLPAGGPMFSLGGMSAGQDPAELLQQQMAILRDIKDVLTNSQSLQEQFVQNTYQ
jgi:hypothetical protein